MTYAEIKSTQLLNSDDAHKMAVTLTRIEEKRGREVTWEVTTDREGYYRVRPTRD